MTRAHTEQEVTFSRVEPVCGQNDSQRTSLNQDWDFIQSVDQVGITKF